ncbi:MULTISPECIES: ATP-binding protein [unclassified Pseudoalteromonas]|uniref:ATP-binding protein n=1 Tax=unclassified Pseudoalteromonas TaxID=194690 RepID=UPI0025B36742|nr:MULTISPECIES: ATP-binding protein [unclassified Pseudoalteromonas]MDN3431466.1 ATP-binding protein [Pseudoalteromonas sp. APC 3907]MDN3433835.1 ATP-binding protein [Pseudoalteromonas sp. APC 3356]MDN3463828.1 ATP-binding protein [Pseudoalteromonas sp. APC 3495]
MSLEPELKLSYSHNIIEHLGLKLYQNRPTNVLAELLSNSWDADAENVWVDINQEHLAVFDDGSGMSRKTLVENYLVIGKQKRTTGNLDEKTGKNRSLMGRKGIGKLAPFGIAKKLSLLTVCKENSKCYWMEINLSGLLSQSGAKNIENSSYKPDVICDGVSIDKVPKNKDPHGYVSKFLGKIKTGGTLIIMDDLSLKRKISKKSLMESIGQRFTVTLLRDDFSVYVDDDKVTESLALPTFAYRFPEKGYQSETISFNGEDRVVRYWVGFVKQAEWSQDQAGVGVYAHGKIAQDRPFVFGAKGVEISTRYMYGVIEADWLDELDEDVVSTDRTSINWNNDATEPMYEWGQELVIKWIREFRKKQKEDNEVNILNKFKTLPDIPQVTSTERTILKDMVCKMSPKIYKDEQLQNEVIGQLTSAWTHRPTRKIINSLWDKVNTLQGSDNHFVEMLNDINEYLVPESLSLSVTVSQKIYALTKLNELSTNGTENQLQALLERFPWILGSDKGKVYANISIKEMAKQAALEGLLPAHGNTEKELKAMQPNSGTRPDFAFFSNDDKSTIIIVELKSPLIPLTYDHLMQLKTYYYWLKGIHPNAKITGYLVGKNTGGAIQCGDPDFHILTWHDICLQSRKDYLELLSSMLNGVGEDCDDSRIQDVIDFGGEPTRELLKRMASSDHPLGDFFDRLDNRLDS